MTDLQGEPESFITPPDRMPVKRRTMFSRSARGLASQHALTPDEAQTLEMSRRRKTNDDSLKLIDNLTNRPIDPMFSDAVLTQGRPRSQFSIWSTRIIVFVICIAVGLGCSLIVKQLHTDPRKKVRSSLVTELQQQNSNLAKTSTQVDKLRSQVSKQSDRLSGQTGSPVAQADELMNGTASVKGPGITLTLAEPMAKEKGKTTGSLPREGSSSSPQTVTDSDLQAVVSLLWQSKAEAVAINGNRVGASTSIRTAGQTILVGVTQVTSPYTIDAIGNKHNLASALSSKRQPQLYQGLNEKGIFPQIKKTNSLTLPAAATVNPSDVQRRN